MDHYQLVKDCLKEKPAPQRELYDLFAKPMPGICYRYTKSITDAEDVLQEGFVKIFRNRWINTLTANIHNGLSARMKAYRTMVSGNF